MPLTAKRRGEGGLKGKLLRRRHCSTIWECWQVASGWWKEDGRTGYNLRKLVDVTGWSGVSGWSSCVGYVENIYVVWFA